MLYLLLVAFNLYILFLWNRRKREKGEKLAWYWGLILPTDVFLLILMSVIGIGGIGLLVLENSGTKNKSTEEEMGIIMEAINNYQVKTGNYPISINNLIMNNPLKLGWKTDQWGSTYNLTNSLDGINLISPGKDMVIGTMDDIKLEIKK